MKRSTYLLIGQLCLIELVAWGVLYYTFSAYLPAMQSELLWSEATLAGGFSLALLISGFAAPLVGGWIDRHDSRGLMVSAAVLGSVGVLLWSLADRLPLYFLAWTLMGCAMAGILYAPAFATVVRFAPERSRNAILVITLVAALASTIFIPLASVLGEQLGWRMALQLLAVGLACMTIPLAATLPRAEKATTQQQNEGPVAATKQAPGGFWTISLALMLADAAGIAVGTHLVVFLIAQGHALQLAAGLAGLLGVAKIVGRLAVAAGSGISAMALLRVSLFMKAAALLVPLMWPSLWSDMVMVIGFGMASGAKTVLRPAMVLELYGTNRFGRSNGLLQLYTTLSKSAGPVGLGMLVGVVGRSWAWGLMAAIVALGGLMLGTVRTDTD